MELKIEKKYKSEELKITEKLAFGLGELPGAASSILAAFLTIFYTDSVGMAAGAIGTMFFISKVFDGVTDLIAGNIVDRTKSKWGKARPWLLWTSVPTGLALLAIFLVPQTASSTGKLIYAFITYNLFTSILYTMVGVAKSSLMPLMTQDGLGRASLAKYSIVFGLGGAILGSSITFPLIMVLGGNITAWRIVFAVYGLITTVGLILSFALSKEHVKSVEETINKDIKIEKFTFKEGMKNFFKNKYFIFTLVINIFLNFSLQLNSSSQLYFYTYTMNDAMLATSLNLVTLIPLLLGIIFLSGPILKKFGKKRSIYIGAGGQIVSYILRGIAAITMNIPLLVLGTIIGGLSTGPLTVPLGTLAADAVDYGEYLTNKRIEGTGSAIVTFSAKISSGLAAGVVGWVLSLTGYIANQSQRSITNFGITCMFIWIPAIFLLIIIISFKLFYNYDKEIDGVMAELERRKNSIG